MSMNAAGIWGKALEDITQPRKLSEVRQIGWVFKSAQCVDHPCQHIEMPLANNMAEVIYAVGEEFTYFQIIVKLASFGNFSICQTTSMFSSGVCENITTSCK